MTGRAGGTFQSRDPFWQAPIAQCIASGVVLSAILLGPVIAAGVTLLMAWPAKDKFFYFIAWALVWLACCLAARAVAWIIALGGKVRRSLLRL